MHPPIYWWLMHAVFCIKFICDRSKKKEKKFPIYFILNPNPLRKKLSEDEN